MFSHVDYAVDIRVLESRLTLQVRIGSYDRDSVELSTPQRQYESPFIHIFLTIMRKTAMDASKFVHVFNPTTTSRLSGTLTRRHLVFVGVPSCRGRNIHTRFRPPISLAHTFEFLGASKSQSWEHHEIVHILEQALTLSLPVLNSEHWHSQKLSVCAVPWLPDLSEHSEVLPSVSRV